MTLSNNTGLENCVIKKEETKKFLKGLSGYTIHAPVQDRENVLFKPVKSSDTIVRQFTNSVNPPKYVVLPQTETMFTISRIKGANVTINEPQITEKNIIFGIRPCDAKAIAILDEVFSGDYKDPYYLKRRENTTLIGLACTDPHYNCFCTSVGGAPDATEGLDMLWTDIGDIYYVSVLTEKGLELIAGANTFLKVTSKNTEVKDAVHKAAHDKISQKLDTDVLPEKLEKMFEDEYWEHLSMKCIGCGSCTYLCPTCYCFDINEIESQGNAKRVRTWDSCQFSSYTIHTSGHNPRPHKANRIRNRIYHKYKYHHDNFNKLGCVGCGRCIPYCPINLNIKSIINELTKI